MEELKAIIRKIRSGELVEGYVLDSDVLKGPYGWYKVQGIDRLRLTELPVEAKSSTNNTKIQKAQGKPHRVRTKTPKEYLSERECACGRIFPLTKFNQAIFKCPECRKSKKRTRLTGSIERKFTCPDCGKEFTISKFQPYYKPERCQKCNRGKHKPQRSNNEL